MSRGNGDGKGTRTGGRSRQSRQSRQSGGVREREAATEETRTLAAFLRELAERAERDPALAARLREALGASGLLDANGHPRRATAAGKERTQASAAIRRVTHRASRGAATDADSPPDPFVLLREHGEAGLRTALEGLDLATLRTIVRSHRLDPARISARWTARERVIELIVTQVRGRANLGKAFARV